MGEALVPGRRYDGAAPDQHLDELAGGLEPVGHDDAGLDGHSLEQPPHRRRHLLAGQPDEWVGAEHGRVGGIDDGLSGGHRSLRSSSELVGAEPDEIGGAGGDGGDQPGGLGQELRAVEAGGHELRLEEGSLGLAGGASRAVAARAWRAINQPPSTTPTSRRYGVAPARASAGSAATIHSVA